MIFRSKKPKPPEYSPEDLARSALAILDAPQLPAIGETSEAEIPEDEPPQTPPPRQKPAPQPEKRPHVAPKGPRVVEGVLEDGDEEEEDEEDSPSPPPPVGDGEGVSIAGDLTLPYDVVTQSIGIVAARGSGKTYLTTVIAEEFLFARLPFVVIDPIGVYWGLRSGADGESPGLDVYILGGEHGDVPLDPTAGKAVARWLVDYRAPAVLDISLMRKAEQRVFVADLAEELYTVSKLPLHIIMDEADLFIPQRASPEEKRVLAAFEDIVRRGRSRGLGITVVTQRPAVIHKDILTQIGTLIVLRMLGPQDRKSIEDWIRFHGDSAKQRMVLSSLASLPIGTAWVWSPGWLGILKRVSIRKKITFDSSATPKAGEEFVPPNYRNELDIDTLRIQLSDAFENDPNDPAVLKARIAELEASLGEGNAGASLVGKLQKRVAELEHKLVANAPKIRTFDPAAFVSEIGALGETLRRIELGLQNAGVLVLEGEAVMAKAGPAEPEAPSPGRPAAKKKSRA
jgi:hypothetical protein